MSCTVSELPTGCRLRGMGSATMQQTSANIVQRGGGSGGTMMANTAGGVQIGGGILKKTPLMGVSAVSSSATTTTTTTATAVAAEVGTGPNNPVPETTESLQRQQAQKPCCFCWCCCCSCSRAKCMAIKNAGDSGPTKRDPACTDLLLNGEQPSLEEIRSWGTSFDALMRSPCGRNIFRDFLRCEYSEENILFWLACEDLKKESNPETIEEKARLIYEDYISILSPKEVSLDSRVREIVNRNMVEPTPHTFDEAQIQIYTLMHRDSYPRFINSQLFKTLAQLQEGLSASGSTTDSPT